MYRRGRTTVLFELLGRLLLQSEAITGTSDLLEQIYARRPTYSDKSSLTSIVAFCDKMSKGSKCSGHHVAERIVVMF